MLEIELNPGGTGHFDIRKNVVVGYQAPARDHKSRADPVRGDNFAYRLGNL
jgi:hypothetical protein